MGCNSCYVLCDNCGEEITGSQQVVCVDEYVFCNDECATEWYNSMVKECKKEITVEELYKKKGWKQHG